MTVVDLYLGRASSARRRAQAGRRPVIILQTVSTLPPTLLVPLTSQLDALRFPGTILVEPDRENGLHRPSVALVFQLAGWMAGSSQTDSATYQTGFWKKSFLRLTH